MYETIKVPSPRKDTAYDPNSGMVLKATLDLVTARVSGSIRYTQVLLPSFSLSATARVLPSGDKSMPSSLAPEIWIGFSMEPQSIP